MPQGLILGPRLFLLYINNLPLIFQGVNFVLCADDTNILVDNKAEAFQHKIAFLMQQLEIQFHSNDLIVNIERMCVISFHSHQNRHPLRPCVMFNRNAISYSSELKFLGLFIMANVPWHVPIHFFCAGLSEVYYMIKSLRDVIYTHMLWSIYYAYFRSRLTL